MPQRLTSACSSCGFNGLHTSGARPRRPARGGHLIVPRRSLCSTSGAGVRRSGWATVMHGKHTMQAMSLRILVLLALTASGVSRADLLSAQLAYSKGDYEKAFQDYRDLAELGQPTAQYNLAIMYAKGQGVRQSELEA